MVVVCLFIPDVKICECTFIVMENDISNQDCFDSETALFVLKSPIATKACTLFVGVRFVLN